jgi:hypothetical protein
VARIYTSSGQEPEQRIPFFCGDRDPHPFSPIGCTLCFKRLFDLRKEGIRMLTALIIWMGCDEQKTYAESYASANCMLLDDCDLLILYGYYDQGGRSAAEVCEENLTDMALSAAWNQEAAETCVTAVESQDCEGLYAQGIPTGCSEWILD